MNGVVTDWRVSDLSVFLGHLAGLVGTVDLDAYTEALRDEIETAQAFAAGAPEPASSVHRRARRQLLLAAAGHLKAFSEAMSDAVAHSRAVLRAVDAEAAERHERPAPGPRPDNVRHLPRAARPDYAGLMRIEDEELPHDPA